ncbi:MAG TPA: hypothetical protein VEH84_11645 [Alphaproteobacteria bacterium]|nr:hypothetical protein [Alphaproteobacteria bacterium]
MMRQALTCLAILLPAAAEAGPGAAYNARDPVECEALTGEAPPTPEQAARNIRCQREVETATEELWLMENVKVQLGKPVPYITMYNVIRMEAADVDKPVHPIRGSWTWSVCRQPRNLDAGHDPALNCRETDVKDAVGGCWQTTFGDWRCWMNGTMAATREKTAPPK